MNGRPIPAMQNIDVMEKVIYMNTFTKTLASTVRISYMVLPKHLVNRFYSELSFYSCTVSNFEQYTLAKFIQDGYFEKHLNRMRNYYHAKRDLLLSKLKNSRLAPYAEITEEDSGLHFIMKLRTDFSDSEFCARAEEKGVKIAAVSSFYYQPPEDVEHYFVVNYSSIAEDSIEEAIECIYELMCGQS
jgi:GntR family transcriptional regulator/MocR family aminotransferase